ncbi:MAG: carboxylating nicotinate-nucleotide diphosphorylase [Deltaproteobacteria bacterium]|nr:carboxylating nicotinate-nucleotide diphosphorylase [Deltaproteobacteria bacterium]
MTDPHLDRLIDLAFEEDLASAGDVTTRATVPPGTRGIAVVRAKESLVLAGVDVFTRVFARLDPSVQLELHHRDGAVVDKGTAVITARGGAHSLLIGERPALNFVMRLSGIATLTAQMVAAVRGTGAQIVDTRKTTPGWRQIEKAAVRAGGGGNHRTGLFDGVLIKDNHLEAAGGVRAAVQGARASAHHLLKIEVECATLAQVDECLAMGVDALLLDNMDEPTMVEAVRRVRAHPSQQGPGALRIVLEASGNMTLERLPKVAATGVDLISMGALTHQARSCDLSMKLKLEP